jgi:hypothetical protein
VGLIEDSIYDMVQKYIEEEGQALQTVST